MGPLLLVVMGLQYLAVWLDGWLREGKPFLAGTFLFYGLANFCLAMHMRTGR